MQLNHVSLSLEHDEFERSWEAIVDVYGELFGWAGGRYEPEPGAPLLLRLPGDRQFVYVYSDDQASTGARAMDHIGVEVASVDELDSIVDRARRRRAHDPRLEISDIKVTPAGPVEIVSCYIRFVLPLMVEVQACR